MQRSLRVCAVTGMLAAAAVSAFAKSNLNLSKSNLYRLTYHAGILTPTQATAMLTELDTLGPMGESQLKKWVTSNFTRLGIKPETVKRLLVLPPGEAGPQTAIILLSDPADEAKARAATVKSSKSNSSD